MQMSMHRSEPGSVIRVLLLTSSTWFSDAVALYSTCDAFYFASKRYDKFLLLAL